MKGGRGQLGSDGSVVIVWGESPNDTRALRSLILGLSPELEGRVKIRRPPLMMTKNVDNVRIKGAARKAIAALKAEAARHDVAAAFFHEDADALEPAHDVLCDRKEAALAGAPVPVHAVAPAWELEAWWLMWPDEVKAHNPSWRSPSKYLGRRVGLVENAKEELVRLLRPPAVTGSFRDYQELDSPGIAEKVRQAGLAGSPGALSKSYDRFRESVKSCVESL